MGPQLASDPSFVERFLREGRVAAELRHRHIVAIQDVGVHQGVAYMALDYLPGGSLASQGTLAPREALRVLREIGSALDPPTAPAWSTALPQLFRTRGTALSGSSASFSS